MAFLSSIKPLLGLFSNSRSTATEREMVLDIEMPEKLVPLVYYDSTTCDSPTKHYVIVDNIWVWNFTFHNFRPSSELYIGMPKIVI